MGRQGNIISCSLSNGSAVPRRGLAHGPMQPKRVAGGMKSSVGLSAVHTSSPL